MAVRGTRTLALAVVVGGCYDVAGDDDPPTFHRDIEPIVQARCAECHREGGSAPMSLVGADEAAAFADAMVAAVSAREMPPFDAFDTSECTHPLPLHDDDRLSDDEIERIEAWRDGGAPPGDPADAPAPGDPPVHDLPGATLDVSVGPWTVTEESYRCFVIDPGTTALSFLTGAKVVPGRRELVHHSLLGLDRTGESAALVDETGSFPCFTIPGEMLAVGEDLPPGLGIDVPVGARIVLQVHFNDPGTPAQETTRVQLRMQSQQPAWRIQLALVGNTVMLAPDGDGLQPGPNDRGDVEFRIPAGIPDHVETMRETLESPCSGCGELERRIVGVANHMHYFGVDMKLAIEQGGESTCLLQTPSWNVEWQRWYMYDAELDALPRARTGDVLVGRCTYDNTLANPAAARALAQQGKDAPYDVWLGQTALDEMCLGLVAIAIEGG